MEDQQSPRSLPSVTCLGSSFDWFINICQRTDWRVARFKNCVLIGSHNFSRACRRLHSFTMSSDWLAQFFPRCERLHGFTMSSDWLAQPSIPALATSYKFLKLVLIGSHTFSRHCHVLPFFTTNSDWFTTVAFPRLPPLSCFPGEINYSFVFLIIAMLRQRLVSVSLAQETYESSESAVLQPRDNDHPIHSVL